MPSDAPALGAFQQMAVHVQCGLDVLVPHECLDGLEVSPVGDQHRRIEVAQIVRHVFRLIDLLAIHFLGYD